ncbi:hydrogenase maturation nickel metallochaperone HypA [Embleya scabrispora]|uniref:hydrogenase maturation nickel metallochaperone HypA/HybF n=1 Tax=Embleya scabrispora TaxID=159449 RepID=UPI000360000E|nr:hydrogenase maturation nickel metallochaperone HypA [Embleya scabrispora]MYS87937.1 hydrogenase maturation nickel metallochaperone HypA [Streptomyces sp. SID5474]
MHEMSIAMAAVEQVEAAAARIGDRAALSVRLRVGELAGVVPDALAFAFEVARAETVLRDAELVIEIVPGRARCAACAVEWAVGMPPDLCCPQCAGATAELLCGRELQILDVCWADPVEDVGYAEAIQEG